MVKLISLSPHKINSLDNEEWQVIFFYLNTLNLFLFAFTFHSTFNLEGMVYLLLLCFLGGVFCIKCH